MLNIVILAAGQGKRMQSNLPKVLHPIAGRPMLTHVLDSARALGAQRIAIVVGHGAEQVKQAYATQEDLQFALQQPQLGTGHAVLQAVPLLKESHADDVTIVLYGDVPLVQPDTLRALLNARANGVAILTEILSDATGYGRSSVTSMERFVRLSSTKTRHLSSERFRRSTQESWPYRHGN